MGNYNLKSNVLRCEKCFSIFRMKIDPGLPESFVDQECQCTTTRTSLKNFLSELSKSNKYKLKCVDCRSKTKEDKDKNTSYCNDCGHIYCDKCISKNHKDHIYISLLKLDFYCIFHQKENFCAFCKDCDINFCIKCIKEKKHINHDIVEFDKIMMTKPERNFLKDKFILAQEKMIYNTNIINALSKKIQNKNDLNKIAIIEKDNSEQNKLILELIKFYEYLYDNSRFKNYTIIYNFIENVNLNVNKFQFWNTNIKIEEALEKIINYFKEDFIIINSDKDILKNDQNNKNEENEKYIDKNNEQRKTLNKIDNLDINEGIDDNYNMMSKSVSYNFKKNKKISDKGKNVNNNKKNNNIKNNKEIKNDNNKDNKNNINDTNKKKNINDKKETEKNNVIIDDNKFAGKDKNKDNKKDINIKKKDNNDKIVKEFKEKEIPLILESKENYIHKKEKEKNNKNDKLINKDINNDKIEVIQEKRETIENEIKKNLYIENKSEIQKMNNVCEFNYNKENKFVNLFSINRFRNKYDSNINLMMINGYLNKRVYNVNIKVN